MIEFILSVILGVGLHQAERITRHMPGDWARLTDYSIGAVGSSPAFVMWLKRLQGVRNPFIWAVASFMLSFLGVGCGVALARLWDTLRVNRDKCK